MREPEMAIIGDLMARALSRVGDDAGLRAIGDDVAALCKRFPIYPERAGI
jgi:glycine/serine hydroxymethyltransferase